MGTGGLPSEGDTSPAAIASLLVITLVSGLINLDSALINLVGALINSVSEIITLNLFRVLINLANAMTIRWGRWLVR